MVETVGTAWGRWLGQGLMVLGVLAWLWPIGVGGSMIVGGDATQFSMGLMAFLGSTLRAGRLPLWNDLWGFGFPGLAESQMGVFYPPHLIYALLRVEAAYSISLVVHSAWGALGASWAARRSGVSWSGSALTGFVWATSGFLLIHLPHQWSYTVGSWMPWAWGLAWQASRGEGSRRTPWLLAAVLAVQVLPGHFQLAFETEVGVLVLALASGRRAARALLVASMAVAGMVPLASMQLIPTAELASLAGGSRDFEYLSGFAMSPFHLINYVAPGLFHRSPLWRPVAWDPFHTSPEEALGDVGLVPLALALAAITRGWRSDPATRALAVLAGLTLILSLGPYAPGFHALIRLPGFSFFRAPARWGLGTALALAILAGKGFDAWRSRPEGAARSLVRFVEAATLMIGLTVGTFELALRGADGGPVASAFEGVRRWMPWPDSPPFRQVIAEAYRPQGDLRVMSGLARLDGKPPRSPGPTLAGSRASIYRRELTETGLLLAALLGVAVLVRRPRAFAFALVGLTAADAGIMARHRPFDLGPSRRLVDQSPVLTRLRAESRGTRTLDPAQNLFQVVGSNPASAYRTLDLPAPIGLLAMARGPVDDPRAVEAGRAAGIGLRVLDPFEARSKPAGASMVRDPALAGWLFGVDLASAVGIADFAIHRPKGEPTMAWLVPDRAIGPGTDRGMVEPEVLLGALRDASPLPFRSAIPERVEVEVKQFTTGSASVVLSRTYDPEWRAEWADTEGERRPATVDLVLGGWQGVKVPGPGRWTLHLDYEGRALNRGLLIASTAWSLWSVGFFWPTRRRRMGDRSSIGSGDIA